MINSIETPNSPEFKAEKLWTEIKRKVDKTLARYNMLGEPRKDAIRMVYVYLPSVIYNQLALPDFIQKKMNESGYHIENRPTMTKVQIHISHYEQLDDEYERVFNKIGDELARAYENTFDADTIIRQNCNEMD